ncbi:UNVERIFIED_CONTAM: hypothetical protein PYX00_002035 [Menopon gallinae]|uniref:Uncharacterized protein n=1 Tax=Menopon gallinae TaxID=328185 RepID=A0AAW2IGK1_9NEOP
MSPPKPEEVRSLLLLTSACTLTRDQSEKAKSEAEESSISLRTASVPILEDVKEIMTSLQASTVASTLLGHVGSGWCSGFLYLLSRTKRLPFHCSDGLIPTS